MACRADSHRWLVSSSPVDRGGITKMTLPSRPSCFSVSISHSVPGRADGTRRIAFRAFHQHADVRLPALLAGDDSAGPDRLARMAEGDQGSDAADRLAHVAFEVIGDECVEADAELAQSEEQRDVQPPGRFEGSQVEIELGHARPGIVAESFQHPGRDAVVLGLAHLLKPPPHPRRERHQGEADDDHHHGAAHGAGEFLVGKLESRSRRRARPG